MYQSRFIKPLCCSMAFAAIFSVSYPALSSSAKRLSPAVQGIYELVPYNAQDYLLDIKTCTVKEEYSNELQLFYPMDTNQQKFYIEDLQDNTWRISDLRSGNALTLSSDETTIRMTSMEHPEKKAAASSQTWVLEPAGNDAFYLQASNDKYLTNQGQNSYKGKSLSLSAFSGSSNQKWILRPTWISSEDSADTDIANPYGEGGKYAGLHLVINIAEGKERLTAADLSEHMSETEEHTWHLDSEFLPAYIEELAAKYNTQENDRRFITSAGKEILLTEGSFGWNLNQEKTLERLKEHLNDTRITTVDPAWTHKVTRLGNVTDLNDIGDSYVEVDIGTQTVWLYQYGKLLLKTNCVTGTKNHTDTVKGAHAVFIKESPAVLNGPGYSSNVTFWMPFFHGYGLHDATWRGSFGGEIYLTSGSHGCVNLPYEDAKTIYNTIQVGYPVIVYDSTES